MRESNDGHVCPRCDTVIYREECACPSDDGLGHDLLQSYLAAAYAQYIHASTRNLVGFVQHSSPLVGVHRLAETFEEVT